MADMMAIVSKAVFERAAGKNPTVGTRLRMDRYVSTNKNLERLTGGGKLYLVTVRPPDEALWLVAVLDQPEFDGEQWIASPCEAPIADISDLKSELEFESGKGLPTKKGTLGMSLQTPRAVTANDVRILDAAAGLGGEAEAPAAAPDRQYPAAEGVVATGTGNRRALLLEAVVADPDNEGARQVYADALVAANDVRGEFILLDTTLDGPLSIRRREALERQREALYDSHRSKWWPYKNLRLRVHRGFVISASGSLKALNAATKLFETEPVTEVEVRGLTGSDGVELLLQAPWLRRVRRLIVRGKIGDEGFAALVRCPALAGVRALNVTGNRIGAGGMAALANNLPNCRTLVLTNNKIGDAGIANLLAWKHLGALETLYLGNCDLSASGVGALLGGAPLSGLVKLALADNSLGNGVGGQLERGASKLPALRHLELAKTGILTAGAKQVAAAQLPTVKRIDLRRNRVDAKLAQEDPRITA